MSYFVSRPPTWQQPFTHLHGAPLRPLQGTTSTACLATVTKVALRRITSPSGVRAGCSAFPPPLPGRAHRCHHPCPAPHSPGGPEAPVRMPTRNLPWAAPSRSRCGAGLHLSQATELYTLFGRLRPSRCPVPGGRRGKGPLCTPRPPFPSGVSRLFC